MALCCIAAPATAQYAASGTLEFPADERFYPGPASRGMVVLQSFCEAWQDPYGNRFRVPFCTDQHASLDISLTFRVASLPPDSLFLYFEGLAQTSEIYLNARLLKITNQPFAEVLIPVPKELFIAGINRLRVRLKYARMNISPMAGVTLPPPLLGIHKPAYLLAKAKLDTLPPIKFPVTLNADTTVVFCPYTTAFGYNMGEVELLHSVVELKREGVHTLYFPFRPSNKVLTEIGLQGFSVSTKPGRVKPYYNPYPNMPPDIQSWVTTSGIHTRSFGKYTSITVLPPLMPKRELVLALAILPILLLVCWKLIDSPGFNEILWGKAPWLKTYEQIGKNQLVRGASLLVVTLLRFTLLAVNITYIMLYWPLTGLPSAVQVKYLQPADLIAAPLQSFLDTYVTLFLLAMALLGLYELVKVGLMSLIGSVYRLRQVPQKMFALEALASIRLPLLLFVCLILFSVLRQPSPEWLTLLISFFLIVFLAYRYLVLTRGLVVVFGMPLLVIILYICALEFLPILFFFF